MCEVEWPRRKTEQWLHSEQDQNKKNERAVKEQITTIGLGCYPIAIILKLN